MPVRSNYSSQSALEGIRIALSPLSGTESAVKDTNHKLDEIDAELKKTRLGHELYSWGQEVEEVPEEA